MNGARLVINAPDNTPGIAVRYGTVNSDDLYIYGQEQEPGERGVLEVHGGKNAAGIGGLCEESTYRHCGNIYICGGRVIAYGGENAVGIGGSHVNDEYSGDGPDRYWQFGGHVEAYGGKNAPGVGAACKGAKFCSMYMRYPDFRVLGGDLETLGGEGRYGIGAYDKEFSSVTCGTLALVDRSLVIWRWNDIMARYGEHYNDEYWIAHNYNYMPLPPAALIGAALIGGYADRYIRFAAVEEITKDTKLLEHDQWYHVTGKVECGPLFVSGSSHLVIEESGDLTVKSENGSAAWPGLRIGDRSSLEVLNGRKGKLTVEHATVDGSGTLKLCGGTMTVMGGVLGSDNSLVLGPRVFKVDAEHWADGYMVRFKMPDGLKLKFATCDDGDAYFQYLDTDERGLITYLVSPTHSLTLTFEPVDNQDDIAGSSVVKIGPVDRNQSLGPDQLPKRTRKVMSVPYVREDGNSASQNAYLFEPPVASSAEVLEDGCWYVVTAKVSVASIEVKGAAHLILADGSQLRADKGGIRIGEHAFLNIYGQDAGTGELIARGSSYPAPDSAGIGSCLNGAGGSVTINGGIVRATGAYNCAGIGAGGMATFGTVTINGGQVVATGGGYAAGIGGGLRSSFDEVTINGGTVTAQHGSTDPFGTVRCAPDIGRGVEGVDGPVTINGGSVKASEVRNAPKNTAGKLLYKVTVECERFQVSRLQVSGLDGYGTRDVYPVDGRVYLWLPEGTHDFTLYDGTGSLSLHYHAIVNGRDIDVEPLPVGFSVNGRDIGDGPEPDSGWSYDGSVLTFATRGNYVLSGFATNDEVQIKVDADDAKIILSNAVVYASKRPAFVANQSTSLLMAGDTSYLAARGDFHAMTVEPGASVAVNLVQERDRLESMICVLNSSDIREAIGGNGEIAVNGGTFVVWGSHQAIENSGKFLVGNGMVMKTGNDVEVAQYTTAYNGTSCVIVGPAVTVTVRDDIPNVTGHTVSNALQEITDNSLDGVKTYRVMLEDDVFVGYTVAEGYASQVGNPLSYPEIKEDILIDASVVQPLPIVSYRAWNETSRSMEVRTCDIYTVVTNATATFEDDRWYVVANDVSCGTIAVEGSAHLILADGVTLTAESLTGDSLTVYGQTKNTGSLVVSGAVDAALTVVGGNVKAGSVTKPVMNAMGQEVFCVTVEVSGFKFQVSEFQVSGLEAYGITGAGVIDGKVYLWLPNGAHLFSLSDGNTTVKYRAVVDGAAVTAEERVSVGFTVNGYDVGLVGAGDGWSYFGKVLTITGRENDYVLSGTAANDEVQIRAHARYESIILDDAHVTTSGRPAIVIVRDNTADKGIYLKMKGGTSELSATGEAAAVQMDRSVELYVGLAEGGVSGTSALAISNTGDDMPAVVNAGSLFFVQGGTLRVSAKERAFWSMPWYDQSLTGKSGNTAETAKYMDEEFLYDTPYVVIAPVCHVKVPKTLPEGIASYIVSNQAEQLPAYEYESTDEHQVFRTMLGDDITVDFKVAWGYEITSGGNVVYSNIHEEQTVAAPTVQKVQTPAWPDPQTVSGQTAAETYGISATSKLAKADAGKIAAWAKDSSVSVDVGDFVERPDAYVDAFLLNCKLEEVEAQAAAYRITGFGRNADGEWAIAVRTENTDGYPYNGKSVIQCFSDAACKTPAEEYAPATLFIRASLLVLPAGDVPPDHGIVVPGPVRIVPVR